jgi:hypothetical protein
VEIEQGITAGIWPVIVQYIGAIRENDAKRIRELWDAVTEVRRRVWETEQINNAEYSKMSTAVRVLLPYYSESEPLYRELSRLSRSTLSNYISNVSDANENVIRFIEKNRYSNKEFEKKGA